jgi:hypothetical protein
MFLRQIRRPPHGSSVFALDGDGFILQVHGVFMRIRSGATAVALSAAAHSDLLFTQRWRRALTAISAQDLFGMATTAWVKNPKGFGFYL